jgi:hypothetical protein
MRARANGAGLDFRQTRALQKNTFGRKQPSGLRPERISFRLSRENAHILRESPGWNRCG